MKGWAANACTVEGEVDSRFCEVFSDNLVLEVVEADFLVSDFDVVTGEDLWVFRDWLVYWVDG